MKYTEKYGVSRASRKYNKSRSYIYFWKQRWDGSVASLACQSRRPHSHPNQHTEAELKLIRDMRRRNPTLGMVELWHRLRKRGYTRCPESLFRVMRKMGLFPAEKPKNPYKPKPYEQMTYPGQRVQVDVKVVPRRCIADPELRLFQYTAIDEFTRLRFLAAYPEQSTYSSADFLRKLRAAAKAADPEAVVLGEVWEDASNKVAYGETRCYCTGDTLDSVMNYPVREAILNFVMGKTSASAFVRLIHHQEEVYPAQFRYALMNLIGSHDRCRALNILAGRECQELSKADQQHVHLNVEEYELAVRRYKLCIDLLCALPGCATVYYGDEVGLTGCHDPWNRRAFPWGREDKSLQKYVANKLRHRQESDLLRLGYCDIEAPDDDTLLITRRMKDGHDALGQESTVTGKEIIKVCRKLH